MEIGYNISIRTLRGEPISNVSVLLAQAKVLSNQEQEERDWEYIGRSKEINQKSSNCCIYTHWD